MMFSIYRQRGHAREKKNAVDAINAIEISQNEIPTKSLDWRMAAPSANAGNERPNKPAPATKLVLLKRFKSLIIYFS